MRTNCTPTAILMIIEGQFQTFQRFSSGKLVLKAVESCFVALNYYENGSRASRGRLEVKDIPLNICIYIYIYIYIFKDITIT